MGVIRSRTLAGLTLALTSALVPALAIVAPASAAVVGSYVSQGALPVAPGVAHDWGSVDASSGRQIVHVVRVDPTNSAIRMRTSLADGRVTARERTTAQALDYSGEGRRVVATTNGSTFGSWPMGHVAARGLNVQNGELLTAGPVSAGPILSFAVDRAGVPMIGTPSLDIAVQLPDGTTGHLDRVNQGRLTDEGVLFTPRFDTHTWTATNGDEYVIDGLDLPLHPSGTYHGKVSAVNRGRGDSAIGQGQVVISVTGTAMPAFARLAIGDAVTVTLTIETGWESTYQAVGGRELLVRNGQIDIVPARTGTIAEANPRTTVGINRAGKILMITVDGRSTTSSGLTLDEIAQLMINLGAVSALNLDGGGSTTMAVRQPGDFEASIVNTPSDGFERTVATTLQVISTAPTGALSGLTVSPSRATLQIAETRQFVAKGYDASYNGVVVAPGSVSWSTSNARATVTSNGLVKGVSPGTVTLRAAVQTLVGTADVTVAGDVTPPSISAPVTRLRSGVEMETAKAKLAIAWSATDNATGVAKIELQRRIDGGTWASVSLATPTATSGFSSVALGHSIQFRARATDGAGNVSQWALGMSVRVRLFDQPSGAITWTGTWALKSSTYAIGDTYRRNRLSGSARLTYTGVQVAWVGLRGPSGGVANVYVDGSSVARVSVNTSTLQYRRVLYVSPRLSAARQSTIELRNASTSAYPNVDVDAFLVLVPVQ